MSLLDKMAFKKIPYFTPYLLVTFNQISFFRFSHLKDFGDNGTLVTVIVNDGDSFEFQVVESFSR